MDTGLGARVTRELRLQYILDINCMLLVNYQHHPQRLNACEMNTNGDRIERPAFNSKKDPTQHWCKRRGAGDATAPPKVLIW